MVGSTTRSGWWRRHIGAGRAARVASVGLAAVLVLLAALIGGTLYAGYLYAGNLRVSVVRSIYYQRARYDLAQELSMQRDYWVDAANNDATYAQIAATSADFARAMGDLARVDDGDDDAAIARIVARHTLYARRSDVLFRIIEYGDQSRAIAYVDTQVTPLNAELVARLNSLETDDSAHTIAEADRFDRLEHVGAATLLAAVAVGLGLATICASVLRTYRRRIEAARAADIARLERAALADNLTGLGNHRAYQEGFAREVARAARHGEALTLALVDLDDFKVINDHNGHVHGDRVLVALAGLLRGLRAGDCAYRLGGDEFALLLPRTGLADALAVAERLREDAQRALRGATVSVGLAALAPGDGAGGEGTTEAGALQEQADAALYEAKRRGRNAVVSFAEVKDSVSITSSAKANAVRLLLGEGQVSVLFQPIWDLGSGEVLAFEALTRPAPEYGLLGPQEAFDIAERIGRAHDLDALCRAAILARAAELPPNALLFVNVSPQTLDHGLLAGTALVEAVAAAGLAPGRVVLEITERSVARLDIVVREARRLQALGFKLALDDTGAGNAGLEMLSQLPVDFVKVDRAVVANALADNAARAVLAGIIAIARETGTYVIAEGIETGEMLDLVRRAGGPSATTGDGVRGVQGYLLGRPGPSIPAPSAMDGYRTLLRAA